MYIIVFSGNAKKQLKKLDKTLQIRIMDIIERLRIRPEGRIKKLINEPAYSLRIGDYRAILNIDKSKMLIFILKISHRRHIYK